MGQRGRPRKLRNESDELDSTTNSDHSITYTDKKKLSKTEKELFTFDPDDLSNVKPYVPGELPKACRHEKTGQLLQRGEPRYYFSPDMRELIRVYYATSKRTEIAWRFKLSHPNLKVQDIHIALRKKLLKKGIPVRGRDF